MNEIRHGIEVFVILLGVSSPIMVIGVIYYLKKRFEHRQIMAAIEKGTPLSEIMPLKPQPVGPAWIRYVSAGVAMVVIGLGVIWRGGFDPEVVVAFVVLGVGAGWLTKGMLYRKYYLKTQPDRNTGPQEKEST
jgi:hypothetical protein